MDNVPIVQWNGELVDESSLWMPPSSGWMRHAPGFYESIKVSAGRILNEGLHYERMSEGASYWNLELPGRQALFDELQLLVNGMPFDSGKLRLQFCVDIEKGSIDRLAVFEQGEKGFDWIEHGWLTAVYRDGFKVAGPDANIKSNHRDIYLKARQWMFANDLDEAVIINQQGKVVESTICNLWWVEDDTIYTPPLHSGCVNGVMRRLLLSELPGWGFKVQEHDAFPGRLEKAAEVFLTNAIRGIRWVSGIDGVPKTCDISEQVFDRLKDWELQQYN